MPRILNGWLEIASFLELNPRTAQQCEREHGMPVHRAGSGRHAPVFAFRAELVHWLRMRDGDSKDLSPGHAAASLTDNDVLGRNRELRTELRRLMGVTKRRVADLRSVRAFLHGAASRISDVHHTKQQSAMEKVLEETSRRLIEAQEQERARIGRELHDDFGQRLAMSIAAADMMERDIHGPPGKLRETVACLKEELIQVAASIRMLAHSLHSTTLDFLDLGAAMKALCREFSVRAQIEVNCEMEQLPQSLPRDIALCLYRVLQEGLQNASKHSHATRIDVNLKATPVELHLVIADIGVGFDLRTATTGQGLGLTGIQERVRLLNGTIMIRSKPMAGTIIHARVPFSADTSLPEPNKRKYAVI